MLRIFTKQYSLRVNALPEPITLVVMKYVTDTVLPRRP